MPSQSAIEINGLPVNIKKILDEAAKKYKKEKTISKACYHRLWMICNAHLVEGGLTPDEFEYWVALILKLNEEDVTFVEITTNLKEVIKVCRNLDNQD